MPFEIVKYPNPLLKKKAQKVGKIDQGTERICQEMKEALVKSQGIGLAAPQVGLLKRIIVVQGKNGPEAFINPRIIRRSRKQEIGEEGCLSLPEIFLNIKRSKEIKVEALNIFGEKVRIEAKDLPARVFQHEIDHLNGVLIIDRISFWQRLKLKKHDSRICRGSGIF